MTRPLQLGFLLAFAGLFLGGLVRLMHLRLETGDVYPRYSSLRTDPFGCKALFESLDRLPGVRTRRNYDSLARFTSDQRCTIFTMGLTPAHFSLTGSAEVAGVIDHVAHGSRWIMAVHGGSSRAVPSSGRGEGADPGKGEKGGPGGNEGEGEEAPMMAESLGAFLGIDGRALAGVVSENRETIRAKRVGSEEIPLSLAWRSRAHLGDLGSPWEAVYQVDDRAVVARRGLGTGTIILIADPYLVSNEALLNSRESGLLAWLAGPHEEIVFDETHLGVTNRVGIASLLFRYRLHGFFMGLAIVVALFVWKNGVRLLPAGPSGPEPGDGHVSGEHSDRSLERLLQRSVAPHELAEACLDAWEKSYLRSAHCPDSLKRRAAEARKNIEIWKQSRKRRRDPVAEYARMAALLGKKG